MWKSPCLLGPLELGELGPCKAGPNRCTAWSRKWVCQPRLSTKGGGAPAAQPSSPHRAASRLVLTQSLSLPEALLEATHRLFRAGVLVCTVAGGRCQSPQAARDCGEGLLRLGDM